MLPKVIPDKLPGTLIVQYVRCGKANCKCSRGELHGPYWYRFWREDGYTLRKEYVRKADLARVQAACAAYADEVREGRGLLLTGRDLLQRISRPANTPAEAWDRLDAKIDSLWLMDRLDDFVFGGDGRWQQRLAMCRVQDRFLDLARQARG